MGDRTGLALRAEVLSKLADQLAEQVAVERRANDELRSLLQDGAIGRLQTAAPPNGSLGPLVAGVAVVITVCAAVAASWLRPTACAAAGSPRFAAASAAVAAAAPLSPPPGPLRAAPGRPVDFYPNGPLRELPRLGNDPLACGAVTSPEAARCFVDATEGTVMGEHMTRLAIVAYTVLGERQKARLLVARYLAENTDSPYSAQIRRVGAIP